jgi:hypothetical protein
MYAYRCELGSELERITPPSRASGINGTRTSCPGTSFNVGDSDGNENGAGERLARLLELSGCTNVVVVVWRWYGGVQLGSDRWRRISEVAKVALKDGDFLHQKGVGDDVGRSSSRKQKRK